MDLKFDESKNIIKNRLIIIIPLLVIVFGIILVNLVDLQIINGNENFYLSEAVKTSKEVIRAPRGFIYDRNNVLLAGNDPSYRLMIDLNVLRAENEKDVISRLADILEIEYEVLWQDYYKKVYDQKTSKRINISDVMVLSNIKRDQVVSIYSLSDELFGVYIEIGTTRNYPQGENTSHIVGYIREVVATEIESGKYANGDYIGAVGIESYYDDDLRGVNGINITQTAVGSETVSKNSPIDPVSGKNLKLTIDTEFQNELTSVLNKGIENTNASGGAAIIMDVNSGEIISLVSLPSFNPNSLINGLTVTEAEKLADSDKKPLFNRAITLSQPPGSTLKTIVASGALQEGMITKNTYFNSTGCMDLGGGYQFCEAGKRVLGNLDLLHGISRSSNIYFCNTGIKLGIEKLEKYAYDFGIGQSTGIDLYGEDAGRMSTPENKKNILNETWYQGDVCNASIGQGLTETSPIQMVAWVSTIANGGKYYKPHLVSQIVDSNFNVEKKFDPEVLREIQVSSENLKIVREGMHLAVLDPWGSGFPLRGLKSDPAVKTGSAETFRKVNGVFERSAHSWVIGFFPYDEPKYAFVVFLEYGGWGYESADVMREFLEWYDAKY